MATNLVTTNEASSVPQVTESPEVTLFNNASEYIEQLFKAVAGAYYNELSAVYPSIAAKVALRKYDNPDANTRKKYYIDQLYHMTNEAIAYEIENDSPLQGQLNRRINVVYNTDGYLTYHIYNMPPVIADMYATLIAFICTLKSTYVMSKIMDQPLFLNPNGITLWNDAQNEPILNNIVPFTGPITREQYNNFAATTRRGMRNHRTFPKLNSSIIYGLLGINPTYQGTHVAPNRFLNGQYIDMPFIKAIGKNNGRLGDDNRPSDGLRRMAYVQLLFLRLINSISTTGNIFAGYSRDTNLQAFTDMLITDTCMLPLWDAVMNACGYVHGNNFSIAGTSDGQLDIYNYQHFLEDFYGWSDRYSGDMLRVISNTSGFLGEKRGPISLLTAEGSDETSSMRRLSEYLVHHPALSRMYGANPIVSRNATITVMANNLEGLMNDLSKAKVGALHEKHFLYHVNLGGNYLAYPSYAPIASSEVSEYGSGYNSMHYTHKYHPQVDSAIITMYIGGPNLSTELAARNGQTVTQSQLQSVEERASTNLHPASILGNLMNCRNPAEVLGFQVEHVPTESDIRRISDWLQSSCKVVFVNTDPVQQGLKRTLSIISGSLNNDSMKIMRSYKAAMTTAIVGNSAVKNAIKVYKAFGNTLYPFRIAALSKALINDRYFNLYQQIERSTQRGTNGTP